MSRLSKVILAAMVLAVWANVSVAADSLSEQQKAQTKLLAMRAARADAMRRLAEQIKGLKITSETSVKDFVAESDTIRTALDAYLTGAQEVGKPKFSDDGICTVTMKVTLQEVVTDLLRIRNAYYKGDKYKVSDIEKMTVTNTQKEIEATGSGAPRPEPGEMAEVKAGESVDTIAPFGKAGAYWKAHCQPQGRLMAVRAARVDAMRRLAERIKGVQINSETTVQDFVAQSDVVNLISRAFLKGAKETGIRYHDDELIVEVEMQVKLRTVFADVKQWAEEHYKGDAAKIQQITEVSTHTEDTIIKETGMGVPPAQYLRDVPTQQEAVLNMARKAPDWVSQTLKAKGNAAIDTENSNKPQAKLMAFRAAELDARRKLAEEINGLMVSSKTSVKDFVAESDEIKTAMLAFQEGAHVVEGSQKLADDGTATVTVEIDLAPLWDTVLFYEKKLSMKTDGNSMEMKLSEKKVVAKPAADE